MTGIHRDVLVRARVPADIWFFAITSVVGAMAHLAAIVLRWGAGELFLGALWVTQVPLKVMLHLALAVYILIVAMGLWRIRSYGYWMNVIQIVWCVPEAYLWWRWGRHSVARGGPPPGLFWLFVRVVWGLILIAWCIWRWRLFRENKRNRKNGGKRVLAAH